MGGEAGGWVSNEVISLKIDNLISEVSMLRQELVRRDVYDAQRAADQARIAALEAAGVQAASVRKQAGFALLGALLALVVSVATRFV